MKHSKIVRVCVSICALMLSVPAGNAAEAWQQKTFDATFSNDIAGMGSFLFRIASDGKGHGWKESSLGVGTNFYLIDFADKTQYTMPTTAGSAPVLAMKLKYKEGAVEYFKDDAIKDTTWTAIAQPKLIGGRPCHGYTKTDAKGDVMEKWFGDDIGFLVEFNRKGPDGNTTFTQTLQKFSTTELPKFALPDGIKVMNPSTLRPDNTATAPTE